MEKKSLPEAENALELGITEQRSIFSASGIGHVIRTLDQSHITTKLTIAIIAAAVAYAFK